jgi:manganese/iron transport system permease protein
MIALALEPFTYQYMTRAIWVSALIGGACAFLSCFLILKGWSLMGDALAHAVVPGVALAYLVKLPYAAGAFLAGLIASFGMAVIRRQARLREDVVIGMVFTSFFAIGLVIISLNPTSVNVQTIVFGNILAISDEDVLQVIVIGAVSLGILAVKWRDLMLVFFDDVYARSIALSPLRLQILFFALLSACTVAALQTVGAILVIAMVITPGATAYLLTDRFGRMIILAVGIGAASSAVGAYASYFLDGSTGGLIVMLQTGLFLAAFVLAPRHGLLAGRRAQRQAPAPPAAGA